MDSDEEEQVIVEVSDAILRDRKDDEISDEEEDHTSTPASRPATRMSTSEVEVRKGKECKIGAWICNCEDLIGNVDRVSYWKSLSFVNPVNASRHLQLEETAASLHRRKSFSGRSLYSSNQDHKPSPKYPRPRSWFHSR